MSSTVPVLRLLAFLFLLVAFLACCVGFFSPFWIDYHPSDTSASSADPDSQPPLDVPSSGSPAPPSTLSLTPSTLPSDSSPLQPSKAVPNATVVRNGGSDVDPVAFEQRAEEGPKVEGGEAEDGDGEKVELVNITSSGIRRMFEGLWVRCDENLVCRCFAQNNFQMEKEFPDWHKAAQGLFTIGLLFLLITLLIGGCFLCCRCCKECAALATALGVLALVGFLPIALSIIIYGGFANHTRNIEMMGDGDRFAWGYFISVAGVLIVPLAALLYFLDGRRKEVIEHEDCETAKMV